MYNLLKSKSQHKKEFNIVEEFKHQEYDLSFDRTAREIPPMEFSK